MLYVYKNWTNFSWIIIDYLLKGYREEEKQAFFQWKVCSIIIHPDKC